MPKSSSGNQTRTLIIYGIAGVLVIGLVYTFWPKPAYVDMGTASRQSMNVTIDEEARTRVRDAYVVSAPIAGHLLRVEVEPGDSVKADETIIARMLASPPSALDARTYEQARAGVNAAEAGVRVARADLNKALADQDLSKADISRNRTLQASGAVSQAALDQAERLKRTADASVDTAKAAISMREAELVPGITID